MPPDRKFVRVVWFTSILIGFFLGLISDTSNGLAESILSEIPATVLIGLLLGFGFVSTAVVVISVRERMCRNSLLRLWEAGCLFMLFSGLGAMVGVIWLNRSFAVGILNLGIGVSALPAVFIGRLFEMRRYHQ